MSQFFNNVLFDDFLTRDYYLRNQKKRSALNNSSNIAVNILNTEEGINLELQAPGYTKDDISLEVKGNVLVISAKIRKIEKELNEGEKNEGEKNDFLVREFTISGFEKRFSLSKEIDTDNISASYDNGILRVKLVKKAPVEPLTKKIVLE